MRKWIGLPHRRKHPRTRAQHDPERPDRASGEEAVRTEELDGAEATPSRMTRLKTERL